MNPTLEIRPLLKLDLEPNAPERGWRKLTIFQEALKDLGERARCKSSTTEIFGITWGIPAFSAFGRARHREAERLPEKSGVDLSQAQQRTGVSFVMDETSVLNVTTYYVIPPETRILAFYGHPYPAAILNPWHSSSFLRATVPPKLFLQE